MTMREHVMPLEARRLLSAALDTFDGPRITRSQVGVMMGPLKPVSTSAVYWADKGQADQTSLRIDSALEALESHLFALDAAGLRAALAQAPLEGTRARASLPQVSLPAPDGKLQRFAVERTQLLAIHIAAGHPDILTFRAYGIDDATAVAHFDLTSSGFSATVTSAAKGGWSVAPTAPGRSTHASYFLADVPGAAGVACEVDHDHAVHGRRQPDAAAAPPIAEATGPNARNVRIAVAATGEWTSARGGNQINAYNDIISSVNAADLVFRRDFNVRFTLVSDASLVYTNSSTDPYTNSSMSTMLGQNQSTLDSVVGASNYDIGHVFGTAGGGIAYIGVVGWPGYKGGGVSGESGSRRNSTFMHEMGHQFGADHTWNYTDTGNNSSQRAPGSAYEPGPGSTIMSYGDVGFPGSYVSTLDHYFHARSIEQAETYLTTDYYGSVAGTSVATGNSAPTVNAGPDYVIPTGTPFALTGTGSDAQSLTYTWEQYDLESTPDPISDADDGVGPLFRSRFPSSSPTRYFPELPDILGNVAHHDEKLPAIARSSDPLTFRLTARDGLGGVSRDEVNVTVVNTGFSFFITNANTSGNTLAGGSFFTLTWNVAGTTGNGINAANVNILLSTDGGNTFPIPLASNTPNDGTQQVQMPFGTGTTQARVKVQPTNNIFFDINNADFTITNVPASTGSISGTTFHDFDNDGVLDPNETRLSGVTVYLDADNDGNLDAGETSASTDFFGAYSFTQLPNGTYNVKQLPTVGYAVQTPNRQVTISAGEAYASQDFANTQTGAIAFNGTNAADNYLLRRNVSNSSIYEVLVGGVLTHSIPSAGVTAFTFNLLGGNDSLTVDYANGSPVPSGGVKYDGGGISSVDTDTLAVNGSGAADTITIVNAEAGAPPANAIILDDLTGTGAVTESVIVNGNAGNDTLTVGPALFAPVTYSGGDNTDTLVYNTSAADNTVSVNQNDVSNGSSPVTFGVLENLTVNTGFGFDTVNVSTGFGAAVLTVDLGDGNDTANVNAANAAAITVLGGAGDDKLVTAMAVTAPITFTGGANTDTVEFNGTNGSDTINVSATGVQRVGSPYSVGFTQTETLQVNALFSTDTINAAVASAGLTTVTLDGGTESDVFDVTPSAHALFRVIGGNPTAAPGDTLTITPAGAVQTSHGPSGEAGFQEIAYSNRQAVRYKEIESVTGLGQAPSIDSLSDSPDPVIEGANLTLTANGVSDPDGGTITVSFYREANGTPGLQVGSDSLLGSDSSDPYALTITAPAAGGYTYYAQATDDGGLTSDVVSTTSTVQPADSLAPTVTNVFVSSTGWNAPFFNFLASSGAGDATYGYRINAAEQTDELPWVNLNRISVRFSEDVLVAADDLAVIGVNVPLYALAPTGAFTYDPVTFTATWTLAGSVANDKLLLNLDADAGGVSDAAGNALDGEWTNPVAPAISADTFPSGDGTAGGDFRFRLNVLPGDVNRSGGSVLGSDVTLVRNNQNFAPGQAGYTIFRDVNGSGSILGSDVTLVRNRQGLSLPTGEPLIP